MINTDDYRIDEATIKNIGLRLSQRSVNAQVAPNSRVFEYPHLENVFIMESDLYGNKMPGDSCFLVFVGNHGFIGKHLKIETLRNSSIEDIRNMIDKNTEG